jgi:hypothetical protein
LSTALGKSSISEKKTGFHPSDSQATEAASTPEQTEPYLIFYRSKNNFPESLAASEN